MTATQRPLAGLAAWLLVCFLAAFVGSMFAPGAWYFALEKPSWTPPWYIFGPVWTLLYALMGISAWMVWAKLGGFSGASKPLVIFLVQLSLNAAWSPLFFGLRSPAAALADITLLWLTLLFTVRAFWRADRAAAVLLVPYLAWTTFAFALNFAIWWMNA